jgi:hypothetical protein
MLPEPGKRPVDGRELEGLLTPLLKPFLILNALHELLATLFGTVLVVLAGASLDARKWRGTVPAPVKALALKLSAEVLT